MWSSVKQAVEAQSIQNPDRIAVAGRDHAFTYSDLWVELNRWAGCITAQCADRDGPVLIQLRPGPVQLAALLGTMAAGRVAIPVDVDDGTARLAQLSELLDIALAVIDPDVSAAMGTLSIPWIQEQRHAPANGALRDSGREVNADAPCRLLFTSGTTGQPRGYLHSHRQLLQSADLLDASLAEPVCQQDRIATLFSPAYAASTQFYVSALMVGATLFPYDARAGSASELAQWLRDEKITILGLTPGLLRAVFSRLGSSNPLVDLRGIILTGDRSWPADIGLARGAMNAHGVVAVQYGATQVGPIACLRYLNGQPIDEPMPVGTALSNVVIDIVDEDKQSLAQGETGLITVGRRDGLPRQYKNTDSLVQPINPDPNGSVRIATGDKGRIRGDGQIEITGRVGSRVKVRGFPVDLAEVEQALLGIEQISQAVVLLERHSNEPRLIAHLGGQSAVASDKSIRQQLLTVLPAHAVPAFFVWWRLLPTTDRGKIDRNALGAVSARTATPSTLNAATTPTERQLERIWADVLELPTVGVDDRFLEIGGDSLRAYVLAEVVREQFHTDIAPASLLQAPTIREQAVLLDSFTDSRGQSLVQLRAGGVRTPIVFLHGVGGGVLYAAQFLNRIPERPAYGFQADSVTALDNLNDMGALADHYIARLPDTGNSPVVLAGYSFGGMLAWEMACRLREMQRPVAMVILIDTALGGPPRAIPLDKRARRAVFRLRRGIHLVWRRLATKVLSQQFVGTIDSTATPDPIVREPIMQHLSGPGFTAWRPPPGNFPVTIVAAEATVNRCDNVWRAAGQQTVEEIFIAGARHEDIISFFGPPMFARINAMLKRHDI